MVNLGINQIHCVDVRRGLKRLPDESIDCVLTSPPFWSLRDYGNEPTIWDGDEHCKHVFEEYRAELAHENRQNLDGGTIGNAAFRKGLHGLGNAKAGFCSKCGAWKGSVGLEPDFNLYIKHLCDIFDEVRRVLKRSGTCWVNLGDTYAGSWGNYVPNGIKGAQRPRTEHGTRWPRLGSLDIGYRPPSSRRQAVPQKSLCLIPMRFALAMVERGWILRNDIVWHKPNPMPSSVKDRFTCSWEHLLFFVKSPRYDFDLDAVRVPHKCLAKSKARKPRKMKNRWSPHRPGVRLPPEPDYPQAFHRGGKNPGDCWDIATRPFIGAHFAVYPEKLCEQPIKAGCAEKVCKRCGIPVSKTPSGYGHGNGNQRKHRRVGPSFGCKCKRGFEPGIVLDPFAGSGTTLVVARRLGRRFLGFEVNPNYVHLAKRRLSRA